MGGGGGGGEAPKPAGRGGAGGGARGERTKPRAARGAPRGAGGGPPGGRLGQGLELAGVGVDVPAALLPAADVNANAVALAPVPGGLSSQVLLQRPDVKAADRAVQAALANVGAARAALLPTITLTASVGSASESAFV